MRTRNKQFLVLNTSCATVINLNKKRKNIFSPLGIDLHKRVNVVHLIFCFFFRVLTVQKILWTGICVASSNCATK